MKELIFVALFFVFACSKDAGQRAPLGRASIVPVPTATPTPVDNNEEDNGPPFGKGPKK